MSALEREPHGVDAGRDWARTPGALRDARCPAWHECRSFVRNLLGGARFRIAGDDLEDVTQEVLVALWRSLERAAPDDLEAWVARLAERRALDHFRRGKRERARRAPGEVHLESLPGAPGTLEDHVRAMAADTLPAVARTFFAEHDPTCLDAMRHFFADEDYRDLARELDVKVNTLIKRWSRCHAALVVHLRSMRLLDLIEGGGAR